MDTMVILFGSLVAMANGDLYRHRKSLHRVMYLNAWLPENDIIRRYGLVGVGVPCFFNVSIVVIKCCRKKMNVQFREKLTSNYQLN